MLQSEEIIAVRARQLVAGWGGKAVEQAQRRFDEAARRGDTGSAQRWAEVGRVVRDLLTGPDGARATRQRMHG